MRTGLIGISTDDLVLIVEAQSLSSHGSWVVEDLQSSERKQPAMIHILGVNGEAADGTIVVHARGLSKGRAGDDEVRVHLASLIEDVGVVRRGAVRSRAVVAGGLAV